LAPSEFVREAFAANGWDKSKFDVLPHFQNLTQKIAPAPDRDAPLLYFGRLSPEKGVQDLIRAMKHVPNLKLVIAGDGPQRNQLEALSRNLDLNNINFAGHVGRADLSPLIARSRFTVLPSHAYETLGKTILESYAESRAVIATD